MSRALRIDVQLEESDAMLDEQGSRSYLIIICVPFSDDSVRTWFASWIHGLPWYVDGKTMDGYQYNRCSDTAEARLTSAK